MKTDSKRIEEKATNVLRDELLKYPIFEPNIKTSDRTPSWDGEVFVYCNDRQKKSNMRGCVPVQVKGKEHAFKHSASFRCEVADLQNYYQNGGCLFFVVTVDFKGNNSAIYYNSLSVLALKAIIEGLDGQKTYTIPLLPFPKNEMEVSSIFYKFLDDKQWQMCIIGKTIPELSVANSQQFESFAFKVEAIGLNEHNLFDFVLTHNHCIYGRIKDVGIDVPITEGVVHAISCVVKESVRVGEKEYYSEYCVIHKRKECIVQIGKCITFNLPQLGKEGQPTKLEFNSSGTLSDLIQEESFLIDAVVQKGFFLGNSKIILGDVSGLPIESFKQKMGYHCAVKRMLQTLHVTEDLEIVGLTGHDESKLGMLIRSVLDDAPVELKRVSTHPYGTFRIGNLVILVWLTRLSSGKYKIGDFYTEHTERVSLQSDDGEEVEIPPCALLGRKILVHLSNLNVEHIFEAVRNVVITRFSQLQIVRLLFEMLSAYDSQSIKDERLLDLAEMIADWLLRQEQFEYHEDLVLNKLQIIRRRREFSFDEKKVLIGLSDSSKEDIRWAVYVLSDEKASATEVFKNMDISMQQKLAEQPLYNLYKTDER